MTCKDCIHNGVCEVVRVASGFKEKAELCKEYKNKANYAEVKHGEWIYYECVSSYDGAKSGFACSCCSGFVDEEIFDMDEFNKDFCGACGAKMDRKKEA